MKLKKLNPQTPGTRHQLNLQKNLLAKSSTICKSLVYNKKKFSGRSAQTGQITVWNRGGGCKKKYRCVLFNNFNIKSVIIANAYDPYRNSFISLHFNLSSKLFFFATAAYATFPGSLVTFQNEDSDLFFGTRTLLHNIPAGSIVFNLSIKENGNAKYSRSAGTFSQILQKKQNDVKIRIPSGQIFNSNPNLYATFGRVSNINQNLVVVGKAGRNRLKGLRPHVRGVAMNPVDHPHGGRTKGGRPSVSPWGILTKGKPTVKKYE